MIFAYLHIQPPNFKKKKIHKNDIGIKMTSIRGYVIERRRCPEGPTGYPLPNLAPAKYNSNAIHAWGNTIWSCGAGGEGRTGLETRKDVNEWKRVPYFTEKNMIVWIVMPICISTFSFIMAKLGFQQFSVMEPFYLGMLTSIIFFGYPDPIAIFSM